MMGAAMLQWRGGGRTVARDPAALSEIRYTFDERASIYEYDGGLDREESERLAWEHVAREWASILDARRTQSRGPTEHWKPPRREHYEQ